MIASWRNCAHDFLLAMRGLSPREPAPSSRPALRRRLGAARAQGTRGARAGRAAEACGRWGSGKEGLVRICAAIAGWRAQSAGHCTTRPRPVAAAAAQPWRVRVCVSVRVCECVSVCVCVCVCLWVGVGVWVWVWVWVWL